MSVRSTRIRTHASEVRGVLRARLASQSLKYPIGTVFIPFQNLREFLCPLECGQAFGVSKICVELRLGPGRERSAWVYAPECSCSSLFLTISKQTDFRDLAKTGMRGHFQAAPRRRERAFAATPGYAASREFFMPVLPMRLHLGYIG